jgi:hypothetical protein
VVERLAVEDGVVVGDDGSAGAWAALVWAAKDAVRRETALHLVRCWSIRSAPRPASMVLGYVPPLADFEAAVREELERRIQGLGEWVPGVDARAHPVHRPAAVVRADHR